MDLGITDRVALVCASTRGLGRGIAQALAADGARVVITGRREEAVGETVSGIPGAVGLTCDLADLEQVGSLAKRAEDVVGDPIDILVLNGGGPPAGAADVLDDVAFSAAIDMLARCHHRLVSDVLHGMRSRGWGRILAVGSSGVAEPIPDLAASNIGRSALAAYLKSLASVVAREGVTCNMILPGRIDTDRVRGLDETRAEREGIRTDEVRATSQAAIPMGRYGTPDEFGRTAAFLCSTAAAYITGSQIRVDGGLARSY